MAPRFDTAQTRPKGKFKMKRSYGFTALLFILGTVFPPLAVAARFGIGTDFFLNLILTICGYIPGHVHNFYIQNIRNNKNNRRTPKWAIRYGLIDDSYLKRKKAKSQWANRYEERLPGSTFEGREVEDGQERDPTVPTTPTTDGPETPTTRAPGDARLWREEDESFYSNGSAEEPSGRWHYPANFDDSEVVPDVSRKKRKSSSKKKSSKHKADRWERSEEAYASASAPAPRKRRTSSRRRSEDSFGADGPEDPLGAGYGRRGGDDVAGSYGSGGLDDVRSGNGNAVRAGANDDDGSLFNHEF